MEKIITESFSATQVAGQSFAREILAHKTQKTAVVLALKGDLGAGKTTFLQGLAKGLGIREVVNSPTFVIMKKFKIPSSNFKFFYHFYLYRLNSPDEVLQLDFQEIIFNPQNIVAIEWPEKLGNLLPKNSMLINFSHLSEDTREIVLDNF